MYLPESALQCIHTLERAGYEAYAVGGCVRDSLLGKTPGDYDLCTNATPEQTASLFHKFTLVRSGEKHGTIGVVMNGQVFEITTFRTEGGYQDSRHPGWVRFVSALQEDLARRDFTVNAMAYNPKTGYIDPFGGQQDLANRVLRTVGEPRERFAEDALRILRGVRFAVRFRLTPESATLQAMKELAPLMDKLARERVFDELCKLLPLLTTEDMLVYADILAQAVPALQPCIGFEQRNPHHCYDVYTHTAHVVEQVSGELALRWAALLHDCGKPDCFHLDENGRGHFHGHAKISAQLAEQALLQLKAPTALRERVCFLIAHHMTPLVPDRKLLRKRLGKYGQQALLQLLELQQADFGGKGTTESDTALSDIAAIVQEILSEEPCLTVHDLKINGNDLQKLGFSAGPDIGNCLSCLLEMVQSEELLNEKQVLSAAALTFLRKQ